MGTGERHEYPILHLDRRHLEHLTRIQPGASRRGNRCLRLSSPSATAVASFTRF